ncbi:amino acid ABC transporter ATP-binding protein [Rhodobacter sp. NTK016B]|uniref:amino acid ABC transporter ATP-binding protein n=1 Tax=Rhodobacter sp. NTK016B TaxID=2759676 RepID=UPI001A8E3DF3|nr:amino acid ABC transporter ATP-binding protein [Rhodobacter sp. NTK016B]MBN8291289.1 amino acid ABC transporter ATP-binding protein [Rhodobacter sp. NTK016B]
MITITHLDKHFDRLHVLKDISLTVKTGEVLVLCGPSGSGKTTLLRTINGLETIDSGTITVDGETVDPKSRDIRRQRQGIGFVFQQFNLFPHLSVIDNITLAPRKLKGLSRDEAEAKAMQLLDRVGLRDKRDVHTDTLSGGQQQRIAIARALAMEPPVLLFDEPTSALDPEMVGEVLSVIRELAQDGMTMLCVTHEMGFARDVASRIIFMADGRIVEDTNPGQFFSAPESARARAFLQDILGH